MGYRINPFTGEMDKVIPINFNTETITGVLPVANGGTGSSGITGIVSGDGTSYNGRTLTQPAAGITIANANGSGGNPTFALANDLAAVEGLATTGLARRSAADTWSTIQYVPATSWTPVLTFGGGSTGLTYSTQDGAYERFGGFVLIRCTIILTNKGSSTGSMQISGVPVSCGTVNALSIRYGNLTFTGTQIVARVQGTTMFVDHVDTTLSTTLLTDANFANNTFLQITGCYQV